jgi:predicted PurR-regulated permease PerM
MFSNFLSGQCLEACILGAMFAVAMAIFNMPYIALVSVLIAVTAFIPIVGALIGCFVGAALIMVEDFMLAVGFIILSLIVQQIENNLVYPKVVGSSIGLPGMWVLLAVAVGGEIMGVAGMFLMIPVVAVIYVLLRDYTNYRLKQNPVAEDKLEIQPPLELSPRKETAKRRKEKRLKNRTERAEKKAAKKQQ